MDCEAGDPPTSIISPAECDLSQVIFTNVQQFYKPNTDVQCKYRREESFASNSKDWIGIFKIGWKTTREYCSWISARTNVDDTVLFKAYVLPKDNYYYQFCYVNHNGEARGTSIPFQFSCNIPEHEMEMRTNKETVELKQIVKILTKQNTQLQEKAFFLKIETQAQAERTQNLQDELLSCITKMQRLETENMKIVKNLTKENTQLQGKVSSLKNKTQAQAERIQNLQYELLSSTTKIQRLEKENKAESDNKIKQMEEFHMTIANLEDEVKRLKDECKSKMEAERTVRQLKIHLQSAEETMQDLERQLAQQKDIFRQQGEEVLTLRSALELTGEDLKDVHKYGSFTSSTSRRPQSLLKCPVCAETFLPHQHQIFEDHVFCHLDGDEDRP